MKHAIKNAIYSAIDVLTLRAGIPRLISGYRIIFPPKWARYFQAEYEQENIKFIAKNCREGMIALDIGAHLGLMSVILGKQVGLSGRVYSFEPTPVTFVILKRIVKLNRLTTSVVCINEAISDTCGQVDFFVDQNEGSNANSLVQRSDKKRSTVKIKTITVDDFLQTKKIDHIDFIKIDAEGSEYQVLLGAQNSLRKFRPKVILAIHPSLIKDINILTSIFNFLVSLNYNIYLQGQILDRDMFCGQVGFFDVHLIPNLASGANV